MSIKPDLKDIYHRLRARSMELNEKISNTLSGNDIKNAGRVLGILHKDTLVFDSEDMLSVLMDYCLYRRGKNGKSKVQSYIEANSRPDHLDDKKLFDAMLESRYSIFQVEDIESGFGFHSHDLLIGDHGFIMDINISQSAPVGAVFAGRIMPIHKRFSMTGGAVLPVDQSAMNWIVEDLIPRYVVSIKGKPLIPFDQHQAMETDLIRYLISHDVADRFLNANIVSHSSSGQSGSIYEPTSEHIGRNDPCPCDSGKKYKKCCLLKMN